MKKVSTKISRAGSNYENTFISRSLSPKRNTIFQRIKFSGGEIKIDKECFSHL